MHRHDHSAHAHGHPHEHSDGSSKAKVCLEPHGADHRWTVASGVRYTRYNLSSGKADLWEVGFGADYQILPWLHIGGEFGYGWFDSREGSAEGWLTPYFHLDAHIPLAGNWELIAGLGVGFPGGEKNLVGDHWTWEPHLELRYDRGPWYVAAGVGLAFIEGDNHEDHDHDSHEEEEHEDGHADHEEGAHDEHAEHDHHAHSGDFHEIVDPHGDREFHYYGAFGVRLLEERVSVEARLVGVHVISGESPADNYLRAGLRTSWNITDRFALSAEGNVPITSTERNDWQTSLSFRFQF
jgi:hypothetical protein